MELTEETLEHLTNEALIGLCREKVDAQILEIQRRKEELLSTRSPFAVFSKRTSKDAFQRELRQAEETLEKLNLRVAQLREIESRLNTVIRGELELYLESSSPDYRHLSTNRRMVDVWQRNLRESSEYLTAFARELRELRSAAPGGQRTRAVAAVREAAHRLAALHGQLSAISRDVAAILATAGPEESLPVPAELNRMVWVQRLAVLNTQQIEVESSYLETETRRFIVSGLEAACAKAEPCRQALQTRVDAYVDHYWQQLRAYALQHLNRDFDVEATITELSTRYIDAAFERYQEELAATPFLISR